MAVVEFDTVIGEDRVIRPPAGVDLPLGQVRIKVWIELPPAVEEAEEPENPELRAMINRMVQAAKALDIQDLPTDLAENHTRYAHGNPTGKEPPPR